MSASMSDTNLERKFSSVSNTQDSIQSLSLWIIHHKNHAKKIVDVWLKVLKKAKISQRLTLFYLTNDVIQNSKRKGTTLFLEAFQSALPEAAILLKDEQIRGSVQRVLKIWEQRTVYSSDFIDELNGVLNNTKTISAAVSKIVAEFKPECTIEKIRQVVIAENETAKKLQALNNTKFDAANSEILRQFKDRKHGQQFSKDFEDATRCLEEYIIAVEKDLALRTELIQVLEQAEIYYDTQRGEARIVSNAYKSFSTRVSAQKKRLEEIIKNLPSPFPSPCADAPSPTNSEGIPDFSSVGPKVGSPVESEPSPEGTPEDLRLSPPIGDPSQGIPQTVSSFMPQAGMMAFWLEAFQNGSPAAPAQEPKSSSSLDSRLMNLMHKIPNKVAPFLEQKGIFPLGGDDTPVKDEHSGQETPVQDESAANFKGKKSVVNHKSRAESAEIQKNKEASQVHKKDSLPNNKKTPNSEVNSKWKAITPQNGISVSQEEKPKNESFIEPLKPPPMPNFENFGFLDSPTLNVGLSSLSNSLSKNRTDPRLNSHNYKSNSKDDEQSDSLQGVDDTEIMDMELEDSDEAEGTSEAKKQKDSSNHKSDSSFSPKNSLSQPSAHVVSSKPSNSVTQKSLINSIDVNSKQLNSSKEKSGKECSTAPAIDVKECPLPSKKGSSLLESPVSKEFAFKSDSIDHRLKDLQKTMPLVQESSLLDSPIRRSDTDATRDFHSSSLSSFSQHGQTDYDRKEFHVERTENSYNKLPNRGFSRIETIQTLRSEEWGTEPAWDMEMAISENAAPLYDYEQAPPYTQPSMPYHMPPETGDFDYRYNNGSNYPNHYDNGIRKYHSHPDKRFPQRPFRRGRRGYFNKQY